MHCTPTDSLIILLQRLWCGSASDDSRKAGQQQGAAQEGTRQKQQGIGFAHVTQTRHSSTEQWRLAVTAA